MSHGDALRRAIQLEPADDTLRLVYADWLDEHDDPARAEFIRTQIDAESQTTGSPEHNRLTDRAIELLRENGPGWAGGCERLLDDRLGSGIRRARFPSENGIELFNFWYSRGFVDAIRCQPETLFSTDPNDIRPEGPLPGLHLWVSNRYDEMYGALESYVGRMASSPVLCKFRDVRIHCGFSRTTDDGLRLLANERGLLAKLRGLYLSEDGISDVGLLPLLESPALSGLCELAIDLTLCTAAASQALLRSDRFRGMTYLHLDGIFEGASGLRPFATPGRWPRLRWLKLGHCGLCDLTLRGLSRPGAFPALEILDLHCNNVHLAGLRVMLSSGAFPRLQELGLGGMPLTLDEVESLRAEFGHRVKIHFPVPRKHSPPNETANFDPAVGSSRSDG